jgi:prepilin-type N-terminal cleavage/methylation domain-containing protein
MRHLNRRARPRQARAFTLLEILVVIAVIAIVLGLLLPAVQKVRAAAARLSCTNNLKQIGLALHSHEGAFGYFPTAGAESQAFGMTGVGLETMGWGYQILPFLEQENLHRIGQQTGPWDWNPTIGRAMVEVPVKVFLCPSRANRVSLPSSWGAVFAMGDYAGVMVEWGFQWQAILPPDPNEPHTFQGIIVKGGHVRLDNPGLTQRYPGVTVTGITDGTSNTIAIMEKAVSAQHYQPTATPYWDWWEVPGWAFGADWPTMRLAGNGIPLLGDTDPRPQWLYAAAGNIGKPAEFGFGSAHVGVVMAVFGDGSVRPVSRSVSSCGSAYWSDASCVLYHLGGRADGWIVDPDSY